MIIHGECLDEMRKMESNSISAIVTDPPYGINFMNKEWDSELPRKEIWLEMLRICKSGAFLLSFGGTRTFHRLTCSIEDAGWEIRDCLMWLYGSGFPKSHNHFGIEGYGTALKPAWEPIIMAMKPCYGTFKKNAEKWEQAGINIEGCRIEARASSFKDKRKIKTNDVYGKMFPSDDDGHKGRWPANLLLDEEAAKMLDEQTGILKSGKRKKHHKHSGKEKGIYGKINGGMKFETHGDSGGASRFFYCAKASSSERDEYNHPTVKPLRLMEYLIKLVMPPQGILLDPFAGVGTTLLAAKNLGIESIGIEKEQEYCESAKKRCA